MISKLKDVRVYLGGPMDRVPDSGRTWRQEITPFLEGLGMVVMDPTNKKLRGGLHIPSEALTEEKNLVEIFRSNRDWDGLSNYMRLLRHIDLRMVDICDIMIVQILPEVHSCGTYEELFWANRSKKPICIVVDGGKENVPNWLFGTLPYRYFFSCLEDLRVYLRMISKGAIEMDKRWTMLDMDQFKEGI
jgi:hypothetical protein